MPSPENDHDREESFRFERRLGPLSALSIGLGTMIGAGIFVLSADAASAAGPAAVVSFVIAGAICVLIAMNVSELATAMPREGGSYHLISRTLGPMAGSVVGPANWLGLVFAGGFYLIGFAQFMQMLTGLPPWLVVIPTGIAVAFLNYWGTGITGRVQRWIVAILLLTLIGFVVRSLFEIEPQLHEPFAPAGWGAAVSVVGLILVAFTGFEKISTVAEEVRRPGRNLPIAIIGSVVVATIVYAAVLFVFTGLVPWDQITPGETALVEASGEALGTLGFFGMLAAGLLATLSSANAAVLASSRICFAMGRDRILPGWLSAIHPDHGTPHRAILLTAALSLALALSGAVALLAEISSALFIVSYVLIAVGVLAMRQVGGQYKPQFRVPLYPWLPALGGLAALAVLATMEPLSLVVGLGLALASIAWYWAWGRERTQVEGAVGAWLRERRPLRTALGITRPRRPPTGRRVLVGLGEDAPSQPLVGIASGIAKGLSADVELVRVRVVPDAVPLEAARQQMEEGQADGRLADKPLDGQPEQGREGQPVVHVHARPGRSLAHGILAATEEVEPVELVLVARQRSRLRATADTEIRRQYDGDSAVFSGPASAELPLRTVRVAVDEGRHAGLALRLARALASASDARLEAVRVVTGPDDLGGADDDGRAEGSLDDATGLPLVTVRAPSVAEGLVDAAREADLMLLGAGHHPLYPGGLGDTARDTLRESDAALLIAWAGKSASS